MQTQCRPGFCDPGVQPGWSASARQALEKGRLDPSAQVGFPPRPGILCSATKTFPLTGSGPRAPPLSGATVPANMHFSHIGGALALCVAPPPRPSLEIQEEDGTHHVFSGALTVINISWILPRTVHIFCKKSGGRSPHRYWDCQILYEL